jgi:hypothetical protein
MKPLPSAPPTSEDYDIWVHHVMIKFLPGMGLARASFDSDRRDAALMLAVRTYSARWDFLHSSFGSGAHMAAKLHELSGGDLGTAFNITNCA